MLITASGVTARGDLGIRAESGDIIVNAAQDTHWSQAEKNKNRFNLGQALTARWRATLSQDIVFYTATSEKSAACRAPP